MSGRLFRRIAGAAVLMAGMALTAGGASAQVAVMVNGKPVTHFEVEQRAKIMQLLGHKQIDRKAVLRDLIDDQVKLGFARKYGLVPSEDQVDQQYSAMAQRIGANPAGFGEFLQRAGISPDSMKAQIRANLVWRDVMAGRIGRAMQVSNEEVDAAIAKKKIVEVQATDYTIQTYIFVVARGTPPAGVAKRQAEANAFRNRFSSCEAAAQVALQLRDVAVRPPIIRNTADLPTSVREVMAKTPVGKTLPPQISANGIEVIGICDKKAFGGDAYIRNEVREELSTAEMNKRAEAFLAQLRKSAVIEYRR